MVIQARVAGPAHERALGLDQTEAGKRLAAQGPNELPAPPRERIVARVLRQARDPMALLLLAAAAVSGIALGEHVDAAAIVAIVVLNTAIGVFQEEKAARALDALRALETPAAKVCRDGRTITIPAREVVEGDLLVLAGGDRIPADVRLLETASFEVDESLLTGESLPVGKEADATLDPSTGVADRPWFAYAGTYATRGTARALVEATGPRTVLGRIAGRLSEASPPTPLQRELGALSARLGAIAGVIAGGVFGLSLVRTGLHEDGLEQAFLTAVALAVAAVPEGLATVVVVGLALGVRRLAVRGAIVRSLPAVETLGSTTVILSDKTGTLTENKMHVATIAGSGFETSPRGVPSPVAVRAEIASVGCNDAELEPPCGDPLEIALLEQVEPERVRTIRMMHPRQDEIPFDAERRRMTTLHRDASGWLLLVKGAPETVLAMSARMLDVDGRAVPMDARARLALLEQSEAMAARGARVIALAERRLQHRPEDLAAAERELTLIASVGLRDRVRNHAAAAVADARGAGVEIVMVTGDQAGTALAVAQEVGIVTGAAPTLTGAQMRAEGLPDDPLSVHVYARVDPDEKLELVRALQLRGHVLAVTGDGVNDAPALRRADIGVAMGLSGCDVARHASDMVITDDDLATVVHAVREGRGIYDNIRKVVDYLVAGNLSEILVVVVGLLAFPSLGVPLLPLQLLWINLLTDGLPALALGVDPIDPAVMRRPPRPRSARLLSARRAGFLLSRAAPIAGVALAALALERFWWDEPWSRARTAMFTVLVLGHLLWAFQARWPGWRDHRSPDARARIPFREQLRRTRWLLVAVLAGIGLQTLIVAWEPGRVMFGLAALDVNDVLLVVVASILPSVMMIGTRAMSRARR